MSLARDERPNIIDPYHFVNGEGTPSTAGLSRAAVAADARVNGHINGHIAPDFLSGDIRSDRDIENLKIIRGSSRRATKRARGKPARALIEPAG